MFLIWVEHHPSTVGVAAMGVHELLGHHSGAKRGQKEEQAVHWHAAAHLLKGCCLHFGGAKKIDVPKIAVVAGRSD